VDDDREQEASHLLRQLKSDLAKERHLLDEEAIDRDQLISQLKDTIQEMRQLTASEQKYLKKETRAHEATVKQQCIRKMEKLDSEKELVMQQHAIEQRAHQAIMDFLSEQREEMDQQIQDRMSKYEEDTEWKGQELEQLKQQRAADLERYEQLVADFEKLEKTVEEDRLAQQREEETRKWEEVRQRAARRLQRWWRRAREKVKHSKGKKKGKGSGKKK